MKLQKRLITAGLLVSTAVFWSQPGFSSEGNSRFSYEVTITNMTRSETFTPILAATHRHDLNLFTAGQPASAELATLAEGGDVTPLTDVLLATGEVRDITNSGGLLAPGASVTLNLSGGKHVRHISMAAMLIPTNDAFFALNNVDLPRKGNRTVYYVSPAYDAGSEPNDELCANMPGPVCGGEGASPGAGGEGYVHIHAGIHGIGDLAPDVYDWRNPVARIAIKRVRTRD